MSNDISAPVTLTSTAISAPITLGVRGDSAYQVAVDNGFVGTEEQWVAASTTIASSTDVATVNLPSLNTPLSSALTAKAGIGESVSFSSVDITGITNLFRLFYDGDNTKKLEASIDSSGHVTFSINDLDTIILEDQVIRIAASSEISTFSSNLRFLGNGNIILANDGELSWTNNSLASGISDTTLYRLSAGTLAIKRFGVSDGSLSLGSLDAGSYIHTENLVFRDDFTCGIINGPTAGVLQQRVVYGVTDTPQSYQIFGTESDNKRLSLSCNASGDATIDVESDTGGSGSGNLDINANTLDVLNDLTVGGVITTASYTVGTVPSASAYTGGIIFVSDEVGGATLAFSDGTNWRRITDRAIIST